MLKPITVLAICLISISLIFTSCKKDHAGPDKSNTGDCHWKLGGYTYTRGSSAQNSSTSDGNTIQAIVVTTTGEGGDYGAYSGSGLTFTFYSNLGTGKYTLANSTIMVSNPGSKILAMSCTIGTAVNTGAVMYTPSGNSTATADVTKDKEGQYHITLSTPVVLTKDVVVGGGIPDAADSYSITIDNAY